MLVASVACGGGKPAAPPIANAAHSAGPVAPPREQYEALDGDARCRVVRPRAVPCVDELTREELVAMGTAGSDADYIMGEVAKKPADAQTNDKVWEVMCAGDTKPHATPDAVYACWDSADCTALAKCVAQRSWAK